jgi:cobalt/nickel transport system ATP-binding protein
VHHSIEVQDLTFSYPDGHPALRGVSFMIAPGEKVALVGPNGAGKSTLLLHLNGILRGAGQVTVCGQVLTDKTVGAIRSAVGMVFEDPDDQLFSPTVFDDVAFGPMYQGWPEPEVSSRVAAALSAVGMADRATRISHHLSSGEKKRIAIATVLAMEPEVLALDEPTSGLDPRARRGLIRLLGDLPMTMLVSTHDLRMVHELFPRTIILDAGLIAADGPTSDLLADPELLQAHGLEAP